MSNEIKKLRRKLNQLESKVNNLNIQKFTLTNILDESSKRTNIKLSNLLHGTDLQDEISYLNDWAEFYSKEIAKYKAKLEKLKQAREKSIEHSFELIFEEKPFKRATRRALAAIQKPSIKYSISFMVLLLIATSLFLLKPSITGYVVGAGEKTYSEDLNLRINESGNYTWNIKNIGDMKSLKATGSIIGNGSVKIYIEKDGKRHLIYKNK